EYGAPVIQVLSRDQRRSQILEVDVASGSTSVLAELDYEAWVDLVAAPRYAPGGRLVWCEDRDDRRRVVVDGKPVSSTRWQVRDIIGVFDDAVLATASDEPTEVQVVRFGYDGSETPLTEGQAVHGAVVGGDTTVISRSSLASV